MSLRRLVALVATLIGLAALPAVAEPDFYAVTGVASNDVLNVRAGPSAGDRIVGALANGQVVRNLGCRAQGSSRWCRIQQLDDMRSEGWVNARYLRESAPPAGQGGGYWAVTGVAANDVLNVRAGPSAGDRIVGALANGQVVRDLGCRTQGNSRWCRIQQLDDMRSEGWVNARYLRESGPPR